MDSGFVIDTSNGSFGRLGNQFFRNMLADVISRKYNIHTHYNRNNEFREMNIIFYDGENKLVKNDKYVQLCDHNFIEFLDIKLEISNTMIVLCDYFQTKDFAIRLRPYG